MVRLVTPEWNAGKLATCLGVHPKKVRQCARPAMLKIAYLTLKDPYATQGELMMAMQDIVDYAAHHRCELDEAYRKLMNT